MSDPLTTGSERLTDVLVHQDPHPTVGIHAHVDKAIKADPGIVALVSYVIDDDCVCKDLKRLAEMAGRPPSPELCGRCATIKLWETGE